MSLNHVSMGTLIGPAHLANDLVNQDYSNFINKSELTILALADGAGSLERSDEGAKLAVEQFLAVSEELMDLENANIEEVFISSLAAAHDLLTLTGLDEEGGCTFVAAIITNDNFIVGGVGDSFSVIQTSDNNLHLVQPPAASEFVNITKLITSENYTLTLCKGLTKDLKNISLCSDAFEQPTLKSREPVKGFWENIFSISKQNDFNIDDLLSFMSSQGKLDDDATIIIANFNNEDTDDEVNIEFVEFDKYDVKYIALDN